MSNVPVISFVRRHFRRAARASSGGFTLLELLIVIGIIALLISLLLPALARTRESARQAVCLGHLQQVAAAVVAYTADNDGSFPGAGAGTQAATNDWIYWRPGNGPGQIQNIATGGIGAYLHLVYNDANTYAVLRCPSDVIENRPASNGAPYPFSYVLNILMSTAPNGQLMAPGGVRTLRQVHDPSQKILVYEENSQTLDDAAGNLWPQSPSGQALDLLSMRHDWSMQGIAETSKDSPKGGAAPPAQPGTPAVLYPDGRGNVAFCDGHAEYISRREAHSKAHFAPDVTEPPFNNPAIP